ncbi:MAG: CotH kinase family protein [Clostridia bacterium]|nr:CotH kinase family protein [Clostridia bacterium]
MRIFFAALALVCLLTLCACGDVVPAETSVPETLAPDTSIPETVAPETKTVETKTVETNAPETEAPETDPPETEAPALHVVEIENIEFISPLTGKVYEECEFSVEDSVIRFGYPLTTAKEDVESAIIRFTVDGQITEKTYDLREYHLVRLTNSEGVSVTYNFVPYKLSYGLPVMEIFTDDEAPIESKTEYVHAVMYIDGEEYPTKIRGRGNASWSQFPKKSYRIKLDTGAALFGLDKNRDWVLTSNYADKSLIRNQVAHDIAAALDGLDFTSTHISVNLFLNGEYLGVYTFADKIEEGKDRLDFSPREGDEPSAFGGMDIGFICEVGWDFDSENIYNRDYFDAQKVVRIYVKEPEIEVPNTPEFTYVKSYILAMEQAIISGEGWLDYIDLDSWVDWFIATELTFNMESAFYRSCYMWKREGGKLMLGPVWDFDMALGNHYGDIPGYDGWCTTECEYEYLMENWMNYLITYDEFNDAVKVRWNDVKDELIDVALTSIDRHSEELEGSQQQNFKRWNIMPYQIGAGAVNPGVYNTYEKQVQYLRDFINQRWAYMDERINREF